MNSTSSMVVGEGLVVDSGALVDDSGTLFEVQLAETLFYFIVLKVYELNKVQFFSIL